MSRQELSVVGNNALSVEKKEKRLLEKHKPYGEAAHEREKMQNILKKLGQFSTLQLTTPRLATDFKLTETMVNKKCSCGAISADEEEVEEEEEEDQLSLRKVLILLERYKKIKEQRSSIALNLVKAYAASGRAEKISRNNIKTLKEYLQHDNFLIKEGALLLIRSLTSSFDNTELMVEEGVIHICFTLMGDREARALHPSLANTLTSIVEKKELPEHWIDLFHKVGLATIITCFRQTDSEEARVAILGLLAQLSSIREMALFILDQHWLPMVLDTSPPTSHNLKTKEAGVRLLVNIAKHDQQKCLSCICQHDGVLPLILYILTLGSCQFQTEAVVFLQLLCGLSNGVTVVIEDLLGFVMAALTSSGCRRVRGACLLLLKKLLLAATPYHTEQIWFELFHYQNRTTTRATTVASSSLETQGITFLVRTLVHLFQQESKMRYSSRGDLVVFGFQPGKESSCMALQHICEILVTFCNLSNRANSALKLCSTVQLLVDNGALSVLVDFLYMFNLKVFGRRENSVVEKTGHFDLLHLHALLELWKTQELEIYSSAAESLESNEINFVSELLHFISLVAESCVDSQSSTQLEVSINKRLCQEEKEEDGEDLTKTETAQHDRPKAISSHDDSRDSGLPRPARTTTITDLQRRSMQDKFRKDNVARELNSVRRHIKTQLYKSGLVQSVRALLMSTVEKWQILSMEILRYTVQPTQRAADRKKGKVKASSNKSSSSSSHVQQRPKSSKTLAERDAMIQKILQQKSEAENPRPQTAKKEVHNDWKPAVDPEHPLLWQCRMAVASLAAAILYNLQHSSCRVGKAALFLLYDLAAHSEVMVHMKLISLGAVPGLIRVINHNFDKNPLLSFLGLMTCQIMMCGDRRVREFFKKYELDNNLRALLSSHRDTSTSGLNREAALTLACMYSN